MSNDISGERYCFLKSIQITVRIYNAYINMIQQKHNDLNISNQLIISLLQSHCQCIYSIDIDLNLCILKTSVTLFTSQICP